MTQETAKAVIDRLQGEAGYATGGYIDRLVFSGLDVHEMLNEIEQAIDADELSVEKLQEELDFTKEYIKKSTEESKEHNDFLDRVIEAVKKLKSDNEIMKKALTEIDRSRYGMQFRRDRNPNVARQALAAIGGDDE